MDRRLYRLTRLSGQPVPVAVVEDRPDPRACPVYPGLVSLLDAATRLFGPRPAGPAVTGQPIPAFPAGSAAGHTDAQAGTAAPGTELQRLRRLIREQFADAVSADHLDADVANRMLAVFGLPELPRRWTVRVGLAFVVEITAGTSEEAYNAAEDAIAHPATYADCPIDVDFNSRVEVYAAAQGVDHDALNTPPSQP